MVYDFHTHTTLSDGTLSPMELIQRAIVSGYRAIAITDHVAIGSLSRVIQEVVEECAMARSCRDILAIPGVELTHVPPEAIAETAKKAKELGAWLVVVHGETIVEPVEKGTNKAALSSPHVDILAHPGLLTLEEAKLAAANGVFLEITTRAGHCLTNGHVASLAKKAGARLILDTDAHDTGNLLTASHARNVIRGTGLDEATCRQVLEANPNILIEKIAHTHKI